MKLHNPFVEQPNNISVLVSTLLVCFIGIVLLTLVVVEYHFIVVPVIFAACFGRLLFYIFKGK